jgi:HD-like signal output (HDOD) protein/CheY-like chemotaxis protein
MAKRHLLFVDDEPMVLKGLQRTLRSMRHEWEILYAESGKAALALLASHPVDVVISDMRMPGMDGAQLLEAVKERFPQVVRIILSGQLDRDMTLQSVKVAHQLLAKPCDVEVLREALQKTVALNQLLADDAIRRVVARIDSLPSMPASCVAIMEELQSADASIRTVAGLIASDLGMTAKMLQMVNSAFFGLYRQVTDAQDAVMLLGLDAIKALVLSVNVFSAFNTRRIPFFDLDGLWQHSLAVGGYAKKIMTAAKRDREQAAAAFLAGMLHDIGKLILAVNFSDAYRALLQVVPESPGERLAREREMIGTTHAEIGAYLMGLWGVEPSILMAIAFHHTPLDSREMGVRPLTAVHFANGFYHSLRQPQGGESVAAEAPDTAYAASLGITGKIEVWRQACADLEESAP